MDLSGLAVDDVVNLAGGGSGTISACDHDAGGVTVDITLDPSGILCKMRYTKSGSVYSGFPEITSIE